MAGWFNYEIKMGWKALKHTFTFFGYNRQSLIVPFLFLAGLLFYWYLRGLEAVMEELIVAIAFTVLPLGLFTVCLFVFNLVRAPYIQYKKDQTGLQSFNSIIHDDYQYLTDRLVVLEKVAKLTEADQPYMEFEFSVFNGSVFTICLDNKINGKIYCKNQPLKDQPELIQPTNKAYWERGYTGKVTIRQFLDNQFVHREMWPSDSVTEFDFDNARIPVDIVRDSNNSLKVFHYIKLGKVSFTRH